jgi:hypothetical protein
MGLGNFGDQVFKHLALDMDIWFLVVAAIDELSFADIELRCSCTELDFNGYPWRKFFVLLLVSCI